MERNLQNFATWHGSCSSDAFSTKSHRGLYTLQGRWTFLQMHFPPRRKVRIMEWSLNNTVVNIVSKNGNSLHICIDLFTIAQNKNVANIVLPFADINAFQVDKLSISWKGVLVYAFPPPILIPRVLQKIREETSIVLLQCGQESLGSRFTKNLRQSHKS